METVDDLPDVGEDRLPHNNVGVRLISLFGTIGLLATLLSFAASKHWVADVAAQLRVQYLLLLIPAVAVWNWTRRSKLACIGGLALAVNLWPIIPYFVPPFPAPMALPSSGSQSTLRLLVLNVLRTNENFAATLKQVADQNADFVFLMEVEPAWTVLLEQLHATYPHQILLCRQDYTGVAFLSKYGWEDVQIVEVEDIANLPLDIRFKDVGDRSATFRLIAAHPLPPFGARLTASRDRQLNALAQRFHGDEANLFVGDFNLTPWSPRFKQVLAAGGLHDASLGYGISPTLTPLPTWIGGMKVDHVLVSDRVIVHDYRLQSDANSDHQQVILEFDVLGP